MLISNILKKTNIKEKYTIRNEQEFETLGLCGARINRKFCTFITDEKYLNNIVSNNMSMIITTKELEEKCSVFKAGIVLTENPRTFFFLLHNILTKDEEYTGLRTENVIAETARISKMAYIAPNNVVIGENVVIEPFVTIYEKVEIGDNTVIRSGCCIGGEGYEFKRSCKGIMAVKHVGGVKIGNNVEIQNNTCIDKAVYPWDNTILNDNVKIDNLVHIAHGVKVDENTMIVAQSGIGGRTIIGKNVWIGFGATLRNGISIGDNAPVNMGAVVTKSVENEGSVTGNFAIPHDKFMNQLKKTITE